MKNVLIGHKLDELLSRRESLKNSLRHTNNLISQGISANKGLPDRWYVRNPQQCILDYLNKKYGRQMRANENLDRRLQTGSGELHGELAFVPHDVDYSWEITEEEFLLAISFETKS